MERILSVEQMRAADAFTIEKLGFTAETLTERAGVAVAQEIISRLKGGRVLVCIGKGNNGADGRVIAKILGATHGFSVVTMTVNNGIFKLFDKKFDIIVDCIFGTGLNREVSGKIKTAIEKINESGAFVVSCDIASGLNGDTGRVMGAAVKANLTVAIQEFKLGHFINDGPDYSGEVIAKDIGISIWGDDYAQRLTAEDAAEFFAPLKRNVNKGCFGKVGVIGGSKSFSGSAVLSMNALIAMKFGNGYSYVAVPDCIFPSLCGLNPECILTSLPDDGENLVMNEDRLKPLLSLDSVAAGMGMGFTEENYKIIKYLLTEYNGKLLIDADGLNTLAKFGAEVLKEKKCAVVLTPHIGEFARLTGKEKEEIIRDPVSEAKAFAKEYGVTLVLKSAVTIITDGISVYLNTTGTPGMAKAGSGDVLSGIIAGLLAKSDYALDSAAAGCWLFGKTGENVAKKLTDYAITASDVVNGLPETIASLV